MKTDRVARDELLALLDGGNAHMSFDEVVDGIPLEEINRKPPNTPYSIWHFVEHIRIAQWDILQFIRNPDHVSPDYPEGYHPSPDEMGDQARWEASVAAVRNDTAALAALVRDPSLDLYAPIPHAPDYNVLREILTVADHTAYHVGELAIMRQVLGLWPTGKEYLTGKP